MRAYVVMYCDNSPDLPTPDCVFLNLDKATAYCKQANDEGGHAGAVGEGFWIEETYFRE